MKGNGHPGQGRQRPLVAAAGMGWVDQWGGRGPSPSVRVTECV